MAQISEPAAELITPSGVVKRFRRALWRQLDPAAYGHEGLSLLNKVVVCAVLAASLSGIREDEPKRRVPAKAHRSPL